MNGSTDQRINGSSAYVGARHRWFHFLALAAVCFPAHAAQLSSAEREQLSQHAESNGGYASVMLSLAELSLEQIRQRGVAAIRQETEVTLTKLRTQLGAEALPTGVWNNGMGQAAILFG